MRLVIDIEIAEGPNHPDLTDFINDMKETLFDYIKNTKTITVYDLKVSKVKSS